MVVYEYKCTNCGSIQEVGSPQIEINHCGKRMRRIYGLTSVHFKGPHFYANEKKRPGKQF